MCLQGQGGWAWIRGREGCKHLSEMYGCVSNGQHSMSRQGPSGLTSISRKLFLVGRRMPITESTYFWAMKIFEAE